MIDQELEEVGRRAPTDAEMERIRVQVEAQFQYRLQMVGGFGGKSDQLNEYNVFCGDPGHFARDLERYRTATGEMLRAAAAEHLGLDRRVLLSVVPAGQRSAALPGSSSVQVA